MLVIPAIDLKDGKCVRLRQGDMATADVFSDDPLAMAGHWASQGARRLHIVDLDGAVAGTPRNQELIREIAACYPHLPIQLGGGVRSEEIAAGYLQAGVRWVIVGTRAVQEPEFVGGLCARFPGQVMVGLDASDGMVATHGWTRVTDIPVRRLAASFESDGVAAIIYTDIGKDGMGDGVNLAATLELADSVQVPVIASGGVRELKDVEDVLEVAAQVRGGGLLGVITGRALYEETLSLPQAQARCDGYVRQR